MTVSPAPSIARTAPARTTSVRGVPKPASKPLATGAVAQRLTVAQGHAFRDIAADLEAANALQTSKAIDNRRDEHIRQALRLVRLARHDRTNAESYVALADGHLCEAIRLDRIVAEHDGRAREQVAASADAGRAVVGEHEALLAVRVEP